MTVVCGVDAGSLVTPSAVAWLADGEIALDLYRITLERPLPPPPAGWPEAAVVAVDAPQGLPLPGERSRAADREAGTPTRALPGDRAELAEWRAWRRLIEVGVELFWRVVADDLADVFGLAPSPDHRTTVAETWPRRVAQRLWPDLVLPTKRRAPEAYVEALWSRITAAGYRCPGVVRPTVDQVDAVLAALAAEACSRDGAWPEGTVGEPPVVDREARVLRGGWIVAP